MEGIQYTSYGGVGPFLQSYLRHCRSLHPVWILCTMDMRQIALRCLFDKLLLECI